jgi:hypothetical protein
MLGVLLAIISPYLKQWLSAAHAYADENKEKTKQKEP